MSYRYTFAAAAALLLAGCGHSEPSADTATNTTVHGLGGDVNLADGGAAPKDLPSYAPAYPGAKVIHSITSSANEGMLELRTSAKPDAVFAFYKEAATKAGLTQSQMLPASNPSEPAMLMLSQPGTRRTLNVSVGPAEDDKSQSKISLAYGAH